LRGTISSCRGGVALIFGGAASRLVGMALCAAGMIKHASRLLCPLCRPLAVSPDEASADYPQ